MSSTPQEEQLLMGCKRPFGGSILDEMRVISQPEEAVPDMEMGDIECRRLAKRPRISPSADPSAEPSSPGVVSISSTMNTSHSRRYNLPKNHLGIGEKWWKVKKAPDSSSGDRSTGTCFVCRHSFVSSGTEHGPSGKAPNSNSILSYFPVTSRKQVMKSNACAPHEHTQPLVHAYRIPSDRDVGSKCTYCERQACTFCTRQCEGCLHNFCSCCSTLDCTGRDDRSFCLECHESLQASCSTLDDEDAMHLD